MEGAERSADLLSDDAEVRAAAFEAAILAALEIDPLEVDVDRLASAYRRLSAALTEDVHAPSSPAASDQDGAAVFGLIYAARTFHAAHRILSAYPPGPGVLVELGAGWGPFALRAALARPNRTMLVDASRDTLDRAQRLFEVCGLAAPTCRVGDLDSFDDRSGAGALGVPFAINELPDRDEASALRRRVERWASMLGPGGRLYLLEPGTPRAARRLQQLRDALPAGLHVHAPCTGAPHCPLLARPTDWCHFTWRTTPGPIARLLADRAQRRWQEQHLSFLVLGREPLEASHALRVLDVRPHGRGKVVARTCGRDGLTPLTALRRDPAHAVVSALEPGTLVRVRGGEQKGDGLRLADPDAVELLGPI